MPHCTLCGQLKDYTTSNQIVAHWRAKHEPSEITDEMLSEQNAERCFGCLAGFVDLGQHVKRKRCNFRADVLVGLEVAHLSDDGWLRGRIVRAIEDAHCEINYP